MTHILNILIWVTIFATIHVAILPDTEFDTLINQLATDSYRDNKIADLEKLALDLVSRLAHQDKLLMDVTSRINDVELKNCDHEFKSQDVHKENYELRSKIKDINEEFQQHVTSSEIHFGVIEQLFEEHVTTSDNRFDVIEQSVEDHFAKALGDTWVKLQAEAEKKDKKPSSVSHKETAAQLLAL